MRDLRRWPRPKQLASYQSASRLAVAGFLCVLDASAEFVEFGLHA